MSANDPKRTSGPDHQFEVGCAISNSLPGRKVLGFSQHKAWSLQGHMQRRRFITLLGGAAAACPLAARSQEPQQMRRVSVLVGPAEKDPEATGRAKAFRLGIGHLGWIE